MNKPAHTRRFLSTAAITLGLLCISASPALAKHKGHKHHKNHAKIMAKLKLSEAQKKELKALRKSFRQQKRSIHQDESLNKAQKKEALFALRKSKKSQLNALLTPAQKREHRALRNAKRERKRSKRIAKLSRKLNLTASQQSEVSKILERATQRGKGIHNQDNLSFKEHKAQMKSHRKSTRKELQTVLTAEQKEKFAAMKKKRRGKGKRKNKGL